MYVGGSFLFSVDHIALSSEIANISKQGSERHGEILPNSV